MRLTRMRFTVGRMMVAVAVVASLLAAERLWQRSKFYRKQAALCAFFEHQCQWYAAHDSGELSDEGFDNRKANIDESLRFKHLKEKFQRVSRRPWEILPSNTPASVNPWDLERLTASEIEEMVEEQMNSVRRKSVTLGL